MCIHKVKVDEISKEDICIFGEGDTKISSGVTKACLTILKPTYCSYRHTIHCHHKALKQLLRGDC